jgi:multiple sugar transport system permease protein
MAIDILSRIRGTTIPPPPPEPSARGTTWFGRAWHFVGCFSMLSLLIHPTVRAEERVTLRIVDWASLEEMTLNRRTFDAFRELHPHISIEYEPDPGRQYEEKLLTALAAGAPPDVFLLDSKLIPTFTDKGVLLDLHAFVTPLGIDTSIWFPRVKAIGLRNGALYSFPKGFTPLMIYYNKGMFRRAGMAFPSPDWDWNDYLRLARALTRDTDGDGIPDEYGTAFTNYYFYWIPWVWTAGGDVVSPDGAHAGGFLDSPQTEEALSFLIDLRRRYHVAPDVGTWAQTERTGANAQLFAQGKIAMILDGHWRMPKYLQDVRAGRLDIGVAGLPRHPRGTRVNVMYESGWCVPVSSEHPREAVLLAAFMAGETASRIRTEGRLEIPSVRRVAEEAAAEDSTGMLQAFVAEVPVCRQPWGSIIGRFSQIEWTLNDAVDEVMIQHRPVHETMEMYANRIDKELAVLRENEGQTFRPLTQHTEILRFLMAVAGTTALASLLLYFRTRGRDRRTTRTALAFLGPSLLHLVVFLFTPIAFAAWLSTHRWDIVALDKPFVGAANFTEMIGDEGFLKALTNTALYTLNVPAGMTLALGVALILHRRLHALGFLRTLYFLPSVTSFVAIALVWMWIYHPTFGIANYALGLAHLPGIPWLNSADTAMMSLIIFSIWLGMGYQMVIFLAGLQGIPEELYEAARIDGASSWQLFRHVTLPLLKPTTFFILITSVIGSFQVFTSVYVMTGGGPVRSTDVLVYHIYQAAWEQLRMGYASALSWTLFVIIMVATAIQFKVLGKPVEY